MEKLLFQDMSAGERLQMLMDNCIDGKPIDGYSYQKELTKEQMQNAKDVLAAAAIQLHKIQEDKKEADKQFNEQIKQQKKLVESKMEMIEQHSTLAVETVYPLIYKEEQKVGIYNRDGVLVDERKATLQEMREQTLNFNDDKGKEVANG